jgi:hypothetical protein
MSVEVKVTILCVGFMMSLASFLWCAWMGNKSDDDGLGWGIAAFSLFWVIIVFVDVIEGIMNA